MTSIDIFPEKYRLDINLPNTRYNDWTIEFIISDFGYLDNFYKLDDNTKTIILQLYHERNIDNNKINSSNWTKKFNCTNSSKILRSKPKYIMETDDYHQTNINTFNFYVRCNELNIDIDSDDIEEYLLQNNLIIENDEKTFTFAKLSQMANTSNSDSYITNEFRDL